MEPKNGALQPQLTASSWEALTALGLAMGICGSGQSWVPKVGTELIQALAEDSRAMWEIPVTLRSGL